MAWSNGMYCDTVCNTRAVVSLSPWGLCESDRWFRQVNIKCNEAFVFKTLPETILSRSFLKCCVVENPLPAEPVNGSTWCNTNISDICIITNQSHKPYNASVLYPIIHPFVTDMCTWVHISATKWCTHVHISVTKWCYMREYLYYALWHLG